jgi:hypothetical protein
MTAVLSFLAKHWGLAAALVVVAALAGGLWHVLSLRTENDRLTLALADSKAQAQALADSLEANRLALDRREAENAALAKEKAQAVDALKAAYGASEEACAWSEEPIPPAVLEALGCAL